MSSKDVRFMVEIPNTGDVNQYVAAMLVRECTSFVTTFAGEWTKNIGLIEEEGFKVTDEGQLVCTKRHFKKDSENLGLFTRRSASDAYLCQKHGERLQFSENRNEDRETQHHR